MTSKRANILMFLLIATFGFSMAIVLHEALHHLIDPLFRSMAGMAVIAAPIKQRGIRLGTKVRILQLFDPDATDEAVGRRVNEGETGKVVERDWWHGDKDTFVVEFDEGGSCCMNRGELIRADARKWGTALLTCFNHPTYRWERSKYTLPGIPSPYMGRGVLRFLGEEGGKPSCPANMSERTLKATKNDELIKTYLANWTAECNCPASALEFIGWVN